MLPIDEINLDNSWSGSRADKRRQILLPDEHDRLAIRSQRDYLRVFKRISLPHRVGTVRAKLTRCVGKCLIKRTLWTRSSCASDKPCGMYKRRAIEMPEQISKRSSTILRCATNRFRIKAGIDAGTTAWATFLRCLCYS